MTASTRKIRFRKVKTPPTQQHRVKATYAVLVDGKVEGHVQKFVEPTGNQPARRYGGTPTITCWGWTRPGVREDPTGYDRRSDAADQIVKVLEGQT